MKTVLQIFLYVPQ